LKIAGDRSCRFVDLLFLEIDHIVDAQDIGIQGWLHAGFDQISCLNHTTFILGLENSVACIRVSSPPFGHDRKQLEFRLFLFQLIETFLNLGNLLASRCN